MRAAASWYRERSPIAAAGFLDAIDAAVAAIARSPEAWPRRLGHADLQAFPLNRYPFAVVYRLRLVADVPIRVLAVAHARRRPDYWARRR